MGAPKIETPKPSDFMPLVDMQADYNRGNVNAGGFGSRTTDKYGNSEFNFDPSLTNTDTLTRAMFEKKMALLNPQFDRQFASMEQRLANQGLPVGSEAYNDDMTLFRQNRDSTMDSIANDSVMMGEQARGQRMNQALGVLGYSPTPVDISGPASIAQSAANAQAQANSSAKGGATGLAGTAMMAKAMMPS